MKQQVIQEHYSTAQFAIKGCVQPTTINRAHCMKGDYLGIKPIKTAGGRLLWPAAEVDLALSGAPDGETHHDSQM